MRPVFILGLVMSGCFAASAQITAEQVQNTLNTIIDNPVNDPSAAIIAYDSIITVCEAHGLTCQKALALSHQSVMLSLQDKYELALKAILQARHLFDSMRCDTLVLVHIYRAEGFMHYRIEESSLADSLAHKAIGMIKPEWTDKGILIRLHGDLGKVDRDFEDAIAHLDTSYQLARMYGHPYLAEQALINKGYLYVSVDSLDIARKYFNQALEEAKKQGMYNHIMTLYNNLAGLSDDRHEVLNFLDSAIHYAVILEDLSSEQLFNENKAYFYSTNGEYKRGYEALWQAFTLKDTVLSIEKYKAIAEMQEKYEAQKRMNEIQNLKLENLDSELKQLRFKRSRNRMIAGGSMMMGLAAMLGYGFVNIRKSRQQLAVEKGRSDRLLLNILPEDIAEELKEKGHAAARRHDQVAIMFTDFKEFTQISGGMSPEELVEELNTCFRAFDGICQKFGIEKIKTIGDAYMAAGGLHGASNVSIKNTVLAALEMQQFMVARKKELNTADKSAFEMRTGMHVGSIVAGIVGQSKFQFDIWGDAVNVANRMESNGEAGKVNISEDTYELLRDDPDFLFESRGMIDAKGKGGMRMWFVRMA